VEAAFASAQSGNRRQAREQLQAEAERLRASGMAGGAEAASDLDNLAGSLADEAPAEEVETLRRQNSARSNEVRSGVMAEDLYHDSVFVE
ncbi:MAG: hypothetical protein KC561_21495, partial [Myxococcales bacterium]|nr:hypothetical protein [Myxococcales bacterium]